ncbi:MAG: DUF4861 family protein [Armatimonadetes bacterium]|nr:DUF4861 family protein [Armatimonadota bacterium]
MKKTQWMWSVALLGTAAFGLAKSGGAQTLAPSLSAAKSSAGPLVPAQIIARAQETSAAQLAALTPNNRDSLDWVNATMWAGIADFASVSGRALEAEAVRQLGERTGWMPRVHPTLPFHADDDAIGQAFLADYARRRDEAALAPIRADMDLLVERLKETELEPRPVVWWWCDALFMAPPVLARLSHLTGDRKYLDAMDKEWWKTAALLYDPAEHLFFRDRSFLKKVENNGQKMFWSRGNGWVLAGLARVLQWMPRDYPTRPRYEQMFRDMAAKLVSLQGQDGMWRASLLDPHSFPAPESSGTAFYCYALAWGVNSGLLPRQTYQNAAERAWVGLVAHRRADHLPGWVQPVGASPRPVFAEGTQLYATGGFLLAATEMVKLKAPATPVAAMASQRAFVRYVPERLGDIAWENNRIAFRIYGPELEKREKTGSGIDVWAKSTRRMVLGAGDWYARNYHKDAGEGLDFYHVGPTRGCGGLGIWDGKKLHVSRAWATYRILKSGPDSAQFELTYAPWDAGGRKVWESRVITLNADSNLNRIQSTFHSDRPGEIMVGIGIAKTKNDVPTWDAARGMLASWAAPTPDGIIGCGVLVDPKMMAGRAEDALNRLILVRAMPEKPFVYYAGAGWDKSGDFATQSDWLGYLRTFGR